MTDLTTLAAQRCAELANGSGWRVSDFQQARDGCLGLALRQFVEQAHHLATAAIAKHPDLADDLAGMILAEPVDADLLIAREACAQHYPGDEKAFRAGTCDTFNTVHCALAAMRLYRQREGGNDAG